MNIGNLTMENNATKVVDFISDNRREISDFLGYSITKKLDNVRKEATVERHTCIFGYIDDNRNLYLFYVSIKEIVMITVRNVTTNSYLLKLYLNGYPHLSDDVKDNLLMIASETLMRKSRMLVDAS